MGNPQFGSVSTVFSPAYVRNASLINPVRAAAAALLLPLPRDFRFYRARCCCCCRR